MTECRCNYHLGMGPNLRCPVHGGEQASSGNSDLLVSRLKAFVDEVIEVAFDGGDCDGAEIQEAATRWGLLKETTQEEPCGDACRCLEYAGRDDFPITCYRKAY